jgi:regulator of sigma E protease
MTLTNILKFLFICLEVLIFFNLMIIVHELGHFLAARWRGLVIEKFGIWFGKPIWQKKINGVIYSLGSIPAGGFVALPQLAPMEVMEGKVETPREQLPPISAWDKIIVAFAGPLFSFLLALVFACAVWAIGRPVSEPESTTVIGFVAPDSPGEKAGLKPGDEIVSVDGHKVRRWGGMGSDSVMWRIVRSEGETIPIEVKREVNGKKEHLVLEPKPVVPETTFWSRKGLRQIKVEPKETPLVAKVEPGSAAAAVGMQPGDAIVAAHGKAIYTPEDLANAFATQQGEPVRLTVERDKQKIDLPALKVEAALVANVVKGMPAAEAGLKPEDRVVAINGQPVVSAAKLSETVRGWGTKPITLRIERKGEQRDVVVTPVAAVTESESRPMIGVEWQDDLGMMFKPGGMTTLVYPGPFEQVRKAGLMIVETIRAIASPKSSVKLQHMGGPVMMMRVYYSFFERAFAEGWRLAFWFSVVLNVNLALLNLLPIPVLDGGHITLALVEAVRRRPVNVRLLEYVQTACAVLIIGFMIYIAFFDVQELFVGSGPRRAQPKPAPAEVQK